MEEIASVLCNTGISIQQHKTATFFFLKCSSMSLVIGVLSVATNTTFAFDSDKIYSSNLSHTTQSILKCTVLYKLLAPYSII